MLRTLGVLGLLVVGIGGFLIYKVTRVSGGEAVAEKAPDPTASGTHATVGVRPSEWAVPAAMQQVVRHPAARGGVPVEVQFAGVDTLERAWLSDDVELEQLSLSLASCVDGAAVVVVAPDTTGAVRAVLDVPARQNRCLARRRGDDLDLDALVPAAHALASWRDGIASAHDAIGALKVGVRVSDGLGGVTLWADGEGFAECVGVDGEDSCFGVGGRTHFPFDDGRVAARVGAVLGL